MKHATLLSTRTAAQAALERKRHYCDKLIEANDIHPAERYVTLQPYYTLEKLLENITPEEFQTILQRAAGK